MAGMGRYVNLHIALCVDPNYVKLQGHLLGRPAYLKHWACLYLHIVITLEGTASAYHWVADSYMFVPRVLVALPVPCPSSPDWTSIQYRCEEFIVTS